jgi:predicted transcriptional regulator
MIRDARDTTRILIDTLKVAQRAGDKGETRSSMIAKSNLQSSRYGLYESYAISKGLLGVGMKTARDSTERISYKLTEKGAQAIHRYDKLAELLQN